MSCRSAVGRRGQAGAERESRSPTFEFVREIAAGRNPFPFGNGPVPLSNSTVPFAAGLMPFGGASFLIGNDSIPVSGGVFPVSGVLFPIAGGAFLMGCGGIPAGSVSFPITQDYFPDAFGRQLNGGVAKECDVPRGWHGRGYGIGGKSGDFFPATPNDSWLELRSIPTSCRSRTKSAPHVQP